MKALELNQEKELMIVDAPVPKVKQGWVLVKLRTAALNHREIWISQGLYPGLTLPCILGADGAGVVEEVGDGVSRDWLGKEVILYPAYDWGHDANVPLKTFRVLGMPDPGTMAEYILVPESSLFQKPPHLSWDEAAAIPVAGVTAWRALFVHGKIEAGSRILITGIGGGVAQAGLSLALAKGATVFVTSSSEHKISDAVSKGAEGGVNYKDEDWPSKLKELSGGIDMVLDSSPAKNLDDYFRFLNYGGRIVVYGSTGSRHTTLNISKFFLRHIQFIGTTMGSPKDFSDLLEFMESHEIQPEVYKSFGLSEGIEAFEELKKGDQIGKIVLRIE
ncbi:MAG: zinc-binding dehydrogenase [Saprospiraceae bacterium]|nr:zinc-binding dehydrogenase [Saprospiraceae bacterium]